MQKISGKSRRDVRTTLSRRKGTDLFENVSEKAWQEWLEHQKMLINEGQINLADRESRKWLNEQMELFLSGEDYAKPSGFVPKE
ncbi:MAG: hypothetical protein CM15mP86_12410 [Gammaproteobacteria bacterium]|nr:MAG: hypothetical protein CM15mP86_12410 [Gammaproteobacteria bacterium]